MINIIFTDYNNSTFTITENIEINQLLTIKNM